MRVLADCHHFELFYSLQLLFEKRFNAELYRPIGLEWYEQGYWNVYPHIDTAKQFLGLDQAINIPKDVHGDLLPESAQINRHYRFEDGIYYVTDATKDKVNRGITLEKFKSMEFDILLSSIPQHIAPFNKLIELYQPKAKHIFQVGNAWGHQPGVKNILASTALFPVPPEVNTCFYHQEFDLETFRYEPPTPESNKIYSYIHYMQRKDLMEEFASMLPDWTLKSYGAGMEDAIMKTQDLADMMRSSTFTWHFKPEGDGYGHVIHNTYAVGRPAIIWAPFYRNKLANALLEDGLTCIDISQHSVYENINTIYRCAQPEEHARMCENAYRRFNNVVDFNAEAQRIKRFLEDLR